MSDYETELSEIDNWRIERCKEAEALNDYIEGHGVSERDIAEKEIYYEYFEKLKELRNKFGIVIQANQANQPPPGIVLTDHRIREIHQQMLQRYNKSEG